MIQDDELFKDKISQKRNNLKNLVLFYSGLKNIVRKKNVKIEAGDNLTLEEVDIEFTCNDVRLGEIH